jgi:DNA-binding transcriptional MerR regulator
VSENTLLKIGDLAKLSGVSVKTIRHYSDTDVLPPSSTTEAGFRLYSQSDWARLELIRTLREAGFGLSAIKKLLQNKSEVSSVLTLQLSAIEENMRNLQRQQALIKLALHQGADHALTYLNHARSLAYLDAAGRKHFLNKHLNRALEKTPAESDWKANLWLWQEGILDLSEEIDGAKFGVWLELAELILNDSFTQRLNDMAKSSWEYQKGRDGIEEWRTSRNQVLTDALKAAQQDELPQGQQCQILVQRYIDVNAALLKRTNDPTFPRYLLEFIEGIADPRFQRYWELIGILKSRLPETMWCKYQARGWLVEGLKWRLAKGGSQVKAEASPVTG